MYFKCSDLVLHNINYFPIAYVRFGFIKNIDTCMSDNGIYSCTREMIEGRADKDQVGSALYAVFLHSYTHCIADVCFFLLNPLVVVCPCCMSHC